MAQIRTPILGSLINKLYTFDEIRDLIQKSIREDASVTVGSGDVIKKGYNTEFDKLKDFATNSKNYLKEYQEEEKIKTNIPSLKIGFNNVFGYYIEVTKVHSNKVPQLFRTQTNFDKCRKIYHPKVEGNRGKTIKH